MKLLYKIVFIWFWLLMIGCDHENEFSSNFYCDYPTGDRITEQTGRIYKWENQSTGQYFYYLGNPDPSLKHGGFVPCNYLIPDSDEGVLVVFSGDLKLGKDAEEPLYFGIELTSIVPSE